jgi:hypothetical protein
VTRPSCPAPVAEGQALEWVVDNDPVFRTAFLVCFGGTFRAAAESYCKRNGIDPPSPDWVGPENPRVLGSTFFEKGTKNFLIWISRSEYNPGELASTIAHEAFHGACHVLDPAWPETEEVFAYYLGYVVREVTARVAEATAGDGKRKDRRR